MNQSIRSLRTPALLINASKVKNNCQRMRDKCIEKGIRLRPHVKTHKTIEGALLQTGGEKKGIVVSTIQEAEFFAAHGFDDIVLARPVTPFVIEQCENLHRKVELHFMVNCEDGVSCLQKSVNVERPFSVLLKVSVGYERAGIDWSDTQKILTIARKLSSNPGIHFQGLYAHCGDSYSKDRKAVKNIQEQSVLRIISVRDSLAAAGVPCPTLGVGSTPSCSIPFSDEMGGLTEVHPGNFVFYDCQQQSYGSCNQSDIAVRVMTRIVSHQVHQNRIIVDLGFTGLTKQGFNEAVPGFGAIQGYPNLKLAAMTQELGKLETVDGSAINFAEFPIDDILFVFPYHACATAGMFGEYFVHDDDDIIREIWRPTRGW